MECKRNRWLSYYIPFRGNMIFFSFSQEAPTPGSYLAFGGGPRSCPGNMFARLQLGILLHHLVVGYRLVYDFPISKFSCYFFNFKKTVSAVDLRGKMSFELGKSLFQMETGES